MTRFVLIRHGNTDAVGKRLAGRSAGVHLNEQGRAQAAALPVLLKEIKLHAIFSSPLERAMETAQPLSEALNLPIQVDEAFLELNFGDWTNKAIEDLVEDGDFKRFNQFRSCMRIPGGEMMAEAQLRFVRGMQELSLKHPNETVAIVSHADMIKSAVAYYAGIHLDLFHRLEISPASVSIIDVFDDGARIVAVNHGQSLSA